jgi:hypothetical protein
MPKNAGKFHIIDKTKLWLDEGWIIKDDKIVTILQICRKIICMKC